MNPDATSWSGRWSDRVEPAEPLSPGQNLVGGNSAAEYSAAIAAEPYHRQRPPRAGVERVRRSHVEATAVAISSRDVAVLQELARVRVLSGGQLERLLFADVSASARERVRRRVLGRLQDWRLVTTLERRVGGVRAGSSGLVYCLDSGGARLLTSGLIGGTSPSGSNRLRRPTTPGSRFLRHLLGVSEAYVRLREAERLDDGRWELSRFDAEPACWCPDGLGGHLKPDAYVLLTGPRFEHAWWLELDLATESLPTLSHKLSRYVDFHDRGGIGPDGVMPRVLLALSESTRARAIPQAASALVVPVTFDQAVERLAADVRTEADR